MKNYELNQGKQNDLNALAYYISTLKKNPEKRKEMKFLKGVRSLFWSYAKNHFFFEEKNKKRESAKIIEVINQIVFENKINLDNLTSKIKKNELMHVESPGISKKSSKSHL